MYPAVSNSNAPNLPRPDPRLKRLDPLYIPPKNVGFFQISPTPMALPSYDDAAEAVQKKVVWQLVAPYLNNSSLAVCCRVSSEFHHTFARVLWANPMATINASSGVSCTKVIDFLTEVEQVRPEVLDLVTIFDFRYMPKIIKGCGAKHTIMCQYAVECDLFYKHLHLFQNARIFFLEGLTDFGSPRVGIMGPMAESTISNGAYRFRLSPVMMSLANCDVQSEKLACSGHLGSLIYLDISGTAPLSPYRHVFKTGDLPNLRILKMRNLHLTDTDACSILDKIGRRLWSLDIRNNQLTDRFTYCFDDMSLPKLQARENLAPEESYFEDTPLYTVRQLNQGREEVFANGLVPLRPDDATWVGRYLSCRGDLELPQPLDAEDDMLQYTGLTHLYISGNKITSFGIQRLFLGKAASRFQVLDVGSVQMRIRSEDPPATIGSYVVHAMAIASKLYKLQTLMRLKSLRIHHSMVTGKPSIFHPETMAHEIPATIESLYHVVDSNGFPEIFFEDPQLNSRIHTLTLTGVPRRSQGPVVDALIAFLRACTKQERILSQVRKLNSSRRSPKVLSGLRTLRLEFHPDKWAPEAGSGPAGPSVSGDKDADEFIAQSMNDFSFFDSPPSDGSSAPVSLPAPTNLSAPASQVPVLPPAYDPFGTSTKDVVKELKAYRLSGEPQWTGKLVLEYLSRYT